MAMLSIPISDDILKRARQHFESDMEIAEYLAEVLQDLASPAPPLDQATINLLDEGLQSELIDASEIDWDLKINRLKAQGQSK